MKIHIYAYITNFTISKTENERYKKQIIKKSKKKISINSKNMENQNLKIYSIEFSEFNFITPLIIQSHFQNICKEYNNTPRLKRIQNKDNKIIYYTSLIEKKQCDLINFEYQDGITIKFYKHIKKSQ